MAAKVRNEKNYTIKKGYQPGYPSKIHEIIIRNSWDYVLFWDH